MTTLRGSDFSEGRQGSSKWEQEPSENNQSCQGSQALGWPNRRVLQMGKLRLGRSGQSLQLSPSLLTSGLVLGWPSSSQVFTLLSCHLWEEGADVGCSQSVRVKQGSEETDTIKGSTCRKHRTTVSWLTKFPEI